METSMNFCPNCTVMGCHCQCTIPSLVCSFPSKDPMVAGGLCRYSVEKLLIVPIARFSTLIVWVSVFLAICTSVNFFHSFPCHLCDLSAIAHADLGQVGDLKPHPVFVNILQLYCWPHLIIACIILL